MICSAGKVCLDAWPLSISVKTTEVGRDAGYDAGKHVYGRKRPYPAENASEASIVLSTPCPRAVSASRVAARHMSCKFADMLFFLLAHVWAVLLDLMWLGRQSRQDKDLEILLLRQQLRILQRKQRHAPRISRWEKFMLFVLARTLTTMTNSARGRLGQVMLVFKPETLLKWHHELVRRKWAFKTGSPRGRPSISPELEALIVRLARENPTWGYSKLQGEVLKLGDAIGRSTIRDGLKRKRVPPAPQRSQQGSSWGTFQRHYQDEIVACDFFTAETAWLKTLYVLFFIELGSRRVHLAAPRTRRARGSHSKRQLSWKIQDGAVPVHFLTHNRDTKFSAAFGTVFTAEDVTIIRTPIQAPNANACAERWICAVRKECLDTILIRSEGRLHGVLATYVDYYNHARPHQGTHQRCPVPLGSATQDGPIVCRDLLGWCTP